MANDVCTHTLSRQTREENSAVLDTIIDKLLGQGLGYDDWKRKLESQGNFIWSESIKNIIIKKEFSFFREEILRLKSEENKSCGLKAKTNSLESILKRLKGLEWASGMPNEMEQRRLDGRLLGKDAKARCLQYHVARWASEVASASQPSLTATTSKEDHEAIPTTNDTNTIFSNLTPTAAVVTSPTTNSITPHLLNNGMFADGDPFTSRKSSHISDSNTSSKLSNEASLPAFDPTLNGDNEIPWAPPYHSQETESHGANITSEGLLRFIEQNPNFQNEDVSDEPSFELPRRHGINDSYSTYISQASRDPSTQRYIIEEILNSYGSQHSQGTMVWDSHWPTSLNQENTHDSGNSKFVQQASTGITTFSQLNFGIPPQNLMHNDCRSDLYTDQFAYDTGTETLPLGNTSSSESFQVEDQEANMCLSGDQNEPSTQQSFYGNNQTSGRAIDRQKASLNYIRAELRKKRDELAAAETTVSNLRNEIKLLEASDKESQQFEGMALEDAIMHNNSHKRVNDEIPHGAKRLKGEATAPNSTPGIRKGPNVNGEGTISPTSLHLSTAKDPLPRTIAISGEGVHHSLNENNDETFSDSAAIPSVGASGAQEPCPPEAVENLGQSLPRKSDDTYPPLTLHGGRGGSDVQSRSMQMQWPGLLDESRKRLSSDSGYASLDLGLFNCRASAIEDLEQSTAWTAWT